jgi:hypothetical protein
MDASAQGGRAQARIGQILSILTQANDKGRLSGLVIIAFEEEGTHIGVMGETDHENILGALERLRWAVMNNVMAEEKVETAARAASLN